jgi:hypothetical protein
VKKYEEGEKPRLPFIQATLMKYSPEYPLAEQAGLNSSTRIYSVPVLLLRRSDRFRLFVVIWQKKLQRLMRLEAVDSVPQYSFYNFLKGLGQCNTLFKAIFFMNRMIYSHDSEILLIVQ